MTRFKEMSDVRKLESIISDQGFYVDTRLRHRPEVGLWVTSPLQHVVIDDATTLRHGLTVAEAGIIHPVFADRGNNGVFHSLTEVTHVLRQLQVCLNTIYSLILGSKAYRTNVDRATQ